MKARVLAYVLPALILTIINLAEAQQAKKVARICYLGAADASTSAVLAKPFRERLREIGYVEGQNLTIEFRHSEGKDEHLPELAAELVRLNCDVIITVGSGAGC
jgi:putative ABC transport system substrate-binding protein